MKQFGTRQTFAIEIGGYQSPSSELRVVDVYADGQFLTCDDNTVYLPAFIGALQSDIQRMSADHTPCHDAMPFETLSPIENHRRLLADAETDNDLHLFHRFMDWGPTADNVSMHLFRIDDMAHIPFSFWRETHHDKRQLDQVYCAQLPYLDLFAVIQDAVQLLDQEWKTKRASNGG